MPSDGNICPQKERYATTYRERLASRSRICILPRISVPVLEIDASGSLCNDRLPFNHSRKQKTTSAAKHTMSGRSIHDFMLTADIRGRLGPPRRQCPLTPTEPLLLQSAAATASRPTPPHRRSTALRDNHRPVRASDDNRLRMKLSDHHTQQAKHIEAQISPSSGQDFLASLLESWATADSYASCTVVQEYDKARVLHSKAVNTPPYSHTKCLASAMARFQECREHGLPLFKNNSQRERVAFVWC